ncbi:hypothetical protein AAKU61_004699, partial [Undibacterium sp. GrIS 1.2]
QAGVLGGGIFKVKTGEYDTTWDDASYRGPVTYGVVFL